MEDPAREGGDAIAVRRDAIYRRVAELGQAERPFALATVVVVQRPTSARPGAHGIVHPDGTIEGWVGGSCAQPIVVREALRSLGDGEPRLLRLSREPTPAERRGEGVAEYVMTCHSGGTLEIYVEPHLPRQQLWVVGTTPTAGAMVTLGAAMGFRVSLIDPIAEAGAFEDADRVITDPDLAGLDPDASPYVVVASQGQWDEEALAAVLGRDVAYVGLVASPKRAAAVRAWLLDEGVPEERVAALRAPCGLDLGASTPEEVAVSILAELIQVRRGRAEFVASPGPATVATQPAQAPLVDESEQIVLVDPVCGMTVERDEARHLAEHGGVIYAFCCVGCRSRFRKDPEAYVGASAVTDAEVKPPASS